MTPKAGLALDHILALLSWFTFVQPSFIVRLTLMSLVGTLLFGYLCWIPLHYGRRTMGSLLTAVAFGLTSTTSLIRLTSIVTEFDIPLRMHDLGLLQAVYLWSFKVSVLVSTVGFILMVNERLRDVLVFNASHDALTGILNRGAFFTEAQVVFQDSLRKRLPLSVALIDLDHFKDINDVHGHATGDRVLQDFCTRVCQTLKTGDIFGRYGGEEFVLLLPGTDENEALARAHRIHDVLQQQNPELPHYTVSTGVANLSASTGTLDALLLAADDAALYQAKHGGRNRVEIASAA